MGRFKIFSVLVLAVLLLISPIAIRADDQGNATVTKPADCTVQKIPVRINYAPGCYITVYILIPSCHQH